MLKIANTYEITVFRIRNQKNLEDLINIFSNQGAAICEIIIDTEEKMEPKLSSEVKNDGSIVSKSMEDMYPFLKRKEFKKNMIIEPVNR